MLEDTLENVVVCKGELDELGEAILKQNASAAMTTPQEDDEKPKDEEHDIKDEDDEKPKDEEQDVKDEDDDLGATLVEQDMVDGTLVHDEEALNATLEDIKGESSSSSTDIGASSPTPGFDDASSTTTAGTLNPNNIRLSVPPTDTEAEDDDTSTIEDEDEEALLDQPPRRFPGTVNPSRANINVSLYSHSLILVIDIMLVHRPNALQESYWLIIQSWPTFGMNLIMPFQPLSSLLNNPKSSSFLCFHFSVMVLAGCDNKKKSTM